MSMEDDLERSRQAYYDEHYEYSESEILAFECDCCGNEIYIGNDYYSCANGERYCENCIDLKEAESE